MSTPKETTNPKWPFQWPSNHQVNASFDEMDNLWRTLAEFEQHLEDNPCTRQCQVCSPAQKSVFAKQIVEQIDARDARLGAEKA